VNTGSNKQLIGIVQDGSTVAIRVDGAVALN
jgi:hypothetical protein